MDIQPNQRIYDVVKNIKKEEFKIPNIQRGYEWDQERVIKLFDSIMRGYPIGALMIWNPPKDILEEIMARKFVDNFDSAADYVTDEYHPGGKESYFLVLDGQQRLQSLYLGFFGSHNGERLYFKVDYILNERNEDENYAFEFLTNDEAKERPDMVHIFDLVNITNKTKFDFVKKLLEKLTVNIEDRNKKDVICQEKQAIIHQNIDLFIEKFNLIQPLLFEIVEKDLSYESVLEVFERVNSGGMVLSRSDLLFCTLKLKIQEMEKKFTDTINFINQGPRYNFDTDFIIKASLVIFDQKAEYAVKKLKNESFIMALRTRYDDMNVCLRQLLAWVEDVAKIKCSRFLRSKAALIPILDYMMQSGKHDKPEGPNSNFMKEYLYMSFFRRLYSRGPDAVLDQIHNIISEEIKKDKDHFPIEKIRDFMIKRQKLQYIFEEHYYNTDADLVLNIVDGGVLQIDPVNPKIHSKDLKLEVDHMFPYTPLTRDFCIADQEVNHLGNYRLVVLPINRRKKAQVPTVSMSFYGDNISNVGNCYKDAIKNMENNVVEDFQKTFFKFRDSRYEEIKKEVKKFLPI